MSTSLIWTYFSIYNIAVYILFFVALQTSVWQLKTTFSFNSLGLGGPYLKLILTSFFSMAGVPPMIGFFSKIFLFILLCGAHLSLGFPFFFIVLFTSLYFYIQNVRFLNASNRVLTAPLFSQQVRTTPLFFSITYLLSFFLIFGVVYLEDFTLVVRWTLLI